MPGKTASPFGKLWGWPNEEEERAYVESMKEQFVEDGAGAVVVYSQLIRYPEQGLQCVQSETWIKSEAGD